GSATLRPTRPWAFWVPGVALVKALLQVTNIQNTNTVTPRAESMRRASERRHGRGMRPDHLDPADLVVDLWQPEAINREYFPGTWGEEYIRKSDRAVKDWEDDRLSTVRHAVEWAPKEPNFDWPARILGMTPEPKGSYPVPGLANADDWDGLRNSPIWKRLVAD